MALAPQFQQTNVGLIPQGWTLSTVGEQFSIQLGKMLDSERNVGELKPYLGNRAVQWGRLDLRDLGFVRLTPSDVSRYRLRPGDLLVCEGGEVGRAAIWNEPLMECYFQKALHRLRPTRGYSAALMLNMLQRWSATGYLAGFVTQTSIAHLPKEKFEQIALPVPQNHLEQKGIADALSDTDALIESLDQLIAKKRHIKQGAVQELLTGRKRLPGFVGKWEVSNLGLHVTFRTGPFGSALHKSDYVDGGVPVINPMQIVDGRIEPTTSMAITEEAARKLSDFRLQPESIVIGRRGDMGRCAYVTAEQQGWLCGTGSMIVKPSVANDGRFLQRVLSSPPVIAAIENASVGSTMINLNQGTLANLVVALPPKVEQAAIATILSDMDAELAALEAKLTKTRQIKQGMMRELLTGRIRLL